MSGKIVTNPIQINDSATATNNFVLKADNAGGVTLSRGNDGATTQDILSVDVYGNVETSKGYLAYAEINAVQSGFTTLADLTGLAVTVNIKQGQRIKITAFIPQVYSSVATDRADLHIREGTTSLCVSYTKANLTSDGGATLSAIAIFNPSAGSHTYKLSIARGAGTGAINVYADSVSKAFILVEAI